MGGVTTETFFRPDAIDTTRVTIPAPLFNRCRLLLSRSHYKHLFIPVRALQFLAVLDAEEIIFVDNQAYAVRDGVGGRMILLAWIFLHGQVREDLSEPAPIDIVYYHPNAVEVQRRMLVEFDKALALFESRRLQNEPQRISKVLPFRNA